MDAQLEDIQSHTTLNSFKSFKGTILDCAKNIKSNDETFKISTLPVISNKLTEVMEKYVETTRQYGSLEKAFVALYKKLSDEEDKEKHEFADFESYKALFQNVMDKDHKHSISQETEAQKDLEQIIRPYVDEDIQVEAPNRQVPKDPITKKDIKIAVKSTLCHHVYDKDGIEDYFVQKEKAGKKRIGCPQAGCTNTNLTRAQLVLDEEINQLIQSL